MSQSSSDPNPVFPEVHYLNATRGVRSWLLTLDHKRIAVMYFVTVLLFFLIGGIFAMAIRLELLTPDPTIMSANTYNRMFTLHGVVMIFMFMIPAIPGVFGNFCLPLMLGAKDVAFPRLNLLSLYLYWTGSLLGVITMAMGGMDTGWTFYAPYSTTTPMTVFPALVGVFILGFSSILTGLNFIVTIHTLRAPGLGWMRLQLFVWAIYATSIIQVLATPVIGLTVMLVGIEKIGGFGLFDPTKGGDPVLFQHMFWFYSHPAVYIMVLPSMGVVSDAIAACARKNVFGYKMIAYSSLGIAFVGFFAWGHHMFVSGQSPFDNGAFAVISMFVGVFTAIKVFNWVGTLYRGSIALTAPFIYICGFLFFVVFGGMTGIAVATISLDVHWHDTYFVVAHFHFIMVGAVIMGFLIAIHYWFPKMFGKKYNETWGIIAASFIVLGFIVTFLPQFLVGNAGMPRRYYMYPERFQALNVASTAGASLLAFGFIIIVIYLVFALLRGENAGDNPWHSGGIEWMTRSPPPTENFDETPVITRDPHSYQKPGEEVEHVVVNAHARPPHLAHHFDTIEQQDYAVRLAMWLFLGTEVLLFAGLFLGYTVYRHFFHETFHHCSRALSIELGTINTIVLITSSLFVAIGYWAVKGGKKGLAVGMLVLTVVCAAAFLFIKYLEYSHKFHVGQLPGKWFRDEDLAQYPGANMYFTIYFLTTGLHAFHVIVGMSVLIWALKGIIKGKYGPDHYVPVELSALYWHLVDLVWISFPLLYLI